MSMQFTVKATGRFRITDIDLGGVSLDADDILSTELTFEDFEDAEVTDGTVTIEANMSVDGIAVEASDIDDYDAEAELDNAIGDYRATVLTSTFEVTEGPTGFETVEDAVGRDTAILVYAELARAGLTVS